jgi:hypothetical protein
LIAIAYTCAVKNGQTITFKGVKEYICRLKENQRKDKRHSNFWVGLYGSLWIENFQMCHVWVEQLMLHTPNKLPFIKRVSALKSLSSHPFSCVVTP